MSKPLKYLYVYILKCSDNTYYTGVTNNPGKRFLEHSTGINQECYTYTRRPLEMVYCERFSDYILAINWEKRIKGWSTKKKEALINSDWDLLKRAAECKNETNYKVASRLRSK
ncbi:MAG: GIY-YIG nuclease family protein [Bacteroidia bacterium]